MRISRLTRELTSVVIILAILGLFLPTSPAVAGWIGTRAATESPKTRITALLDQQEVVGALADLGIDPAEAKRRVAGMTEREAMLAMEHMESIPAGGSAVGAIVGAAVLVFIILLITDLLGLTDVFTFVKKTAT